MITPIEHEDLNEEYFWELFNSMNYCRRDDSLVDRALFDQTRPTLLQIKEMQIADMNRKRSIFVTV
jgi:hypothetical protein